MKTITHKDLQPQDRPGDGWQIIEAPGDHHNEHNGHPLVQVIDAEAIRSIVESGISQEEGLLIDRDHLSLDDEHTTEAMGWVKDLAALKDDQGNLSLCGWIEWSSEGRALIEGKVYKKFSTVYLPDDMDHLGGDRYRPVRLAMLALTNIENNPGQRPITNRRTAICNSNKPQDDMTAIADKLGLPAEATEEEILQAITSLQETIAKAQDAEAEAILNSEGGSDLPEEEKEMMKEELVVNRGRALKVLRSRAAKAKAEQPSAAQTPKSPLYAGGVVKNRGSVLGQPDPTSKAIAIRDRAHELQRLSGLDYFTALNIAQRECRS